MDVVITKIGLEKIANATVDSPLSLTYFAVGDGNNAPITPNENMTALVNEKYRDFINGTYSNENILTVECTLRAEADIQEGFKIFEIGIFDYEGDLIAISQTPEQYRPAKSEGIATELIASIVLKLSNTANITVEIPETVFATTEALTRETENREEADSTLDNKISSNKNDLDSLKTKFENLITVLNNYQSRRIGVLFYYSGNEAPEGALKCDGSIVEIAKYQKLFSIIGHKYNNNQEPSQGKFKLPDGQNRYLRGSSSSRITGSYEEDVIKSHKHKTDQTIQISLNTTHGSRGSWKGPIWGGGDVDTGIANLDVKGNREYTDDFNGSSGSNETRGKGVMALTCIWYE